MMVEPQKPPYLLYNDEDCESKNSDNDSFEQGFESVINLLKHKKNVLVFAGAGISVSCGLPDFRSKDTGLYSTLDTHELGLTSPEELFDIQIFQDDPRPFYKFAKQSFFFSTGTEKKEAKIQPSPSHFFLAWLEQTNRLLRVYTQNIDGLEESAGVSPNRIVYAHGSLRWAQCMKCRAKLDTSELLNDVMANKVPLCKKLIIKKNHKKQKRQPTIHFSHSDRSKGNSCNNKGNSNTDSNTERRKRSRNDAKVENERSSTITNPYKLRHRKARNNDANKINDSSSWEEEKTAYLKNNNMDGIYEYCGGVMKPGVTFFGEKLKDQVSKSMERDYPKVDALLVMGTSLSVTPMSKMIRYFPSSIPRILINQNLVQPPKLSTKEQSKKNIIYKHDDKNDNTDFRNGYVFDACLLGFCDDITSNIWNSLLASTSDNIHNNKKLKHHQINIIKQPVPTEALDGKLLCNIIQNENMNTYENCEGDNSSNIHHATCNSSNSYSKGNNNYQVYHHPTNRIFLFRGAIMNKKDNCDDKMAEHIPKEVAVCDGCEKEITGTIMKCSVCFDFDLCQICFPIVSKQHVGGKHTFIHEEQDSL